MLPTRAYIFIFLNAVRFLSIVALLLVFASSIVTMVHDIQAVNHFIAAGKISSAVVLTYSNSTSDYNDMLNSDYINGSTVPNQPAGAFWAVLNRLLIIGQVVVLILSEIGWPAAFFDRFFPVLGNEFGLGALGVIQCLLGAAILSHHVDTFSLVSAFFLFSLGCLNVLVGLIWRERAKSKRSLLAWRDKDNKSVLPTTTNIGVSGLRADVQGNSFLTRNITVVSHRNDAEKADDGRSGLGFGRQGEKAAALKGFSLRPVPEALPGYVPKSVAAASDTDATAV